MTGFDSIETPALLVDMDALEWNITVMADFMKGRRVRLRPHFKTHKSPAICHMQLAAGAKGICCAKLGEAEVLLTTGIPDVLIANQIVDPAKIARLAGLARGARVTVCADNEKNVADLSAACARAGSTLNVLVEVDVGMNRCGVKTAEEAVGLAKRIAGAPGLHFEGIQAYEGHLVQLPKLEDRRAGVRKMLEEIGRVKSLLEKAGLTVKEISGGEVNATTTSGRGSEARRRQQQQMKLAKSAARLHLAVLPNPVEQTRKIRIPRQVSHLGKHLWLSS